MTTPEGDVYEADDDTWRAQVTGVREWEANEADLIEQAIAIPDDDSEFDR